MLPVTAVSIERATVPLWISCGLGLYVMVIYGVTYYAIGTAAPRIAAEFGTSTAAIFGVLSASLLINAMLAPRVGRWIDRVGAGQVLVIGSALRAAGVVWLSQAVDPVSLVAAIFVIQLMAQLTEYDATFAAVVQIAGDDARGAISIITLWGGIASTVFWPLSAWLLDQGTWRTLFLVYGALMVAVSVPIAFLVMIRTRFEAARRVPLGIQTEPRATNTPHPGPAEPAARMGPDPAQAFVPVAAAFALGGFAMGMPVMLLPVLEQLGLGATAILAGVVFGPSQTAGRFFELVFGRALHPLTVAVLAGAALPLSFVILLAGGTSTVTAVIFAMLYGAGAGVSYIVRGTVVLALFGPERYGYWLGHLARVRLIVAALTPFVLALILDHFGAAAVIIVCAATSALAVFFFMLVARSHAR